MPVLQPTIGFPTSTSQSIASLGTKLGPKDSRSAQSVSQQFEGMFLSQLLKEMRGTLQPGTMFAGDKSDIQGGLFDMIMSKHLSESGGIGMAKYLEQALQARTGQTTKHATTLQSTQPTGEAVSGASGS